MEPLVVLAAVGAFAGLCSNLYARVHGKEGSDLKSGLTRVALGAVLGVVGGVLGVFAVGDKASLFVLAGAAYAGIDLVELLNGKRGEIKEAIVGSD